MKPSADDGLVPAPLSKAQPPYPLNPGEDIPAAIPPAAAHAQSGYPAGASGTPAFNFKTPDTAGPHKDDNLLDESDYSDEDWDKSDDDDTWDDPSPAAVPDALKPAGGKSPATTPKTPTGLPDALRAGPPAGVQIKKSYENISPMPTGASSASYGGISTISHDGSTGSIPLKTNNPYLQMQTTGQSTFDGDNVWGDLHGQSQRFEPVELPASQTPATPTNHMANLSLHNEDSQDHRKPSVDQPPLIALETSTPLTEYPKEEIPSVNPWSAAAGTAPLGGRPDVSSHEAAQKTWQEPDIWQQGEPTRHTPEPAGTTADIGGPEAIPSYSQHQYQQEQVPGLLQHSVQPTTPHVENDTATPAYQPDHAPPLVPQTQPPHIPHAEEPPRQEQPQHFTPQQTPSPSNDEPLPPLPPRRSMEEQPPPFPPRPLEIGIARTTSTGPESPNTVMNRQRREHYQIKHIRWHDVNKPGIRTSPILTQNLNGPCPLLALVNALILSTPSGIETALVETLRTREQVSLGLLLDAVFDELMSGRRGDAAQELPDVSDLYKFLLALHTGLNVNPMFVPDTEATHGNSAPANLLGPKAGGFENTPDMRLYRTFDIPLIHGWLPEEGSEAYQAFERVAKSYETSQYVQFQEEELDAKLQSGQPLTDSEQQMFTDIHAIKEFLGRWPTQLTDHGLKVMKDSLKPGQAAILFRNDHFSTLLKDPRTQTLVTLVTDQGYSSHDEIVWESLVDVNGMGSELFSGDFRSVGNHDSAPQGAYQQQQPSPVVDNGQGWTTVPTRRPNQQQINTSSNTLVPVEEPTSPTGLSRAEQEDHDLALALQLQEEEEDRQRREAEQRVRDNQASEQAIAAQARERPANRRASRPGEQAPVIPPRRNNITGHRPNEGPAPPPTYEEASTTPRYNPPPGHPANPTAPLPGQQGSAYQANASVQGPGAGAGPAGRRFSGRQPQQPGPSAGRPGRRQSAGAALGPNGEERDKCVVM